MYEIPVFADILVIPLYVLNSGRLTSTIISRFMFNLKQVAEQSLVTDPGRIHDDIYHDDTLTRSYWSTIRFNASAFMGLGNLGESLRLGDSGEEEENRDMDENEGI